MPRKMVKMSFKGKSCIKLAVGLNINEAVNNWNPGVHLSPPRGNIHVYYYHNSYTSSPLKQLSNQSQIFNEASIGSIQALKIHSPDQDDHHDHIM